MIGRGPEIQRRAISREVTGISYGICAFTAQQRQGPDKGIGGKGGMDVEVAEENFRVSALTEVFRCGLNARNAFLNGFLRHSVSRDFARPAGLAIPALEHAGYIDAGPQHKSGQNTATDYHNTHASLPLNPGKPKRDRPGTKTKSDKPAERFQDARRKTPPVVPPAARLQ